MTETPLSLLKLHEYFRGLSDEILAEVAGRMEVVYCETGDVIHEANTPIANVGFVVRGRVKLVVVDADGREKLLHFAGHGDQIGMISAALPEPVPIRVIAVEPSTLLRLGYEDGMDLTAKHRELRRRWNEALAGKLRKALLGDTTAKKSFTLAVFHETAASRGLVRQLVERFGQVGEKPCVLSDVPEFQPPAGVPSRAIVADDFLSPDRVRQQLSEWSQCNRHILDLSAHLEPGRAARLMEASDHVLWCTTPDTRDAAAGHLRQLVSRAPAFRDKVSLVWYLADTQISPSMPGRRELAAREFIVTSVPASRPLARTVANGLERLVHYLRGVQVGLALGGGAALGMAHLGVLKAIEENGIVIDMLAGTSAGAMTGVLYAAGLDADYLADEFVKNLRPSWVYKWMPHGQYLYLLRKYRKGQFGPMLRQYIADWKLEQLPLPCAAVTVDLVSGTAVVRDHGNAVDAILESINLPVLSSPLCRPGQALIDGGFLNNVPADVLVSKGCNFVIAVDVLAKIESKVGGIQPDTPLELARAPSVVETVLRTYAVLSHNMTAIGVNPADVRINPDVSKFSMADFTLAVEAAAVGKQKTLDHLPELRKLLRRLDGGLFPG